MGWHGKWVEARRNATPQGVTGVCRLFAIPCIGAHAHGRAVRVLCVFWRQRGTEKRQLAPNAPRHDRRRRSGREREPVVRCAVDFRLFGLCASCLHCAANLARKHILPHFTLAAKGSRGAGQERKGWLGVSYLRLEMFAGFLFLRFPLATSLHCTLLSCTLTAMYFAAAENDGGRSFLNACRMRHCLFRCGPSGRSVRG